MQPVTSVGMRSGVNWTRPKSTGRPPPVSVPISVFPSPGRSSISTCPSAEQREQDELEPVPLADDRPFELVEDAAGVLLHLCELHQSASRETTTCRSDARSIPSANRS